jgi:hypothetical protein
MTAFFSFGNIFLINGEKTKLLSCAPLRLRLTAALNLSQLRSPFLE